MSHPFLPLSLFALCTWHSLAAAATPWSPLKIDVWDPPFNAQHQVTQQTFTALSGAAQPWQLCVLIPHLKDAYWLAVNYALIDEARRLGVRVEIFEAGGYERLDNQRRQAVECMERGDNALIVGAVSADGLNDLIARYADQGRVVIDLINGVSSPKLSARVAADFFDLGTAVGTYIREASTSSARPVTVAWLPGPNGAGWVKAGDEGFRRALQGSNATIVETRYGDTGVAVQGALVSDVLAKYPGLDYIAGTAVTAEAAVQILRKLKNTHTKVLSYYYGPGVDRGVRRGTIVGAPSDRPVLQARLAVDLAVRILEGKPYLRHVAAPVVMVDRKSYGAFDPLSSLAPPGYRPVFSSN
jgi:protein TorT